MTAISREACPPCPKTDGHIRDRQPPSFRMLDCPGRNVSEVRIRNTRLTCGVLVVMSQARDIRTSCTDASARIGYTRVSTVSQPLDQQNTALEVAGVMKTFSDTMSGARDDRPGLAALMEYVREGDTVVVWKLARPAGPQHAPHPGDRQGPDGTRRLTNQACNWLAALAQAASDSQSDCRLIVSPPASE
jgi:hypothetical protein